MSAVALIKTPLRVTTFTAADVENAHRAGFQDGVEAAQLERQGKPFIHEQEALDRWLQQSHG